MEHEFALFMGHEFALFRRATTRDCSLLECAAHAVSREYDAGDEEIVGLPTHLRDMVLEMDPDAPEIEPATEDVHSGWWEYVTCGRIDNARARQLDDARTLSVTALLYLRHDALIACAPPTALGCFANFPWQLQNLCDAITQLPRVCAIGRFSSAPLFVEDRDAHLISAVDPRDYLIVFM